MKLVNKQTRQQGFSLLEIIIASAVFVLLATAAVVAVISAINTNRLGAEQTIANQFNAEGIEAARAIKNKSWTTLTSKTDMGNTGVSNSSGTGIWAFSGTNNTLPSDSRFTRTITVTSVQRDSSGNIGTGLISPAGLTTKGSTLDNGDSNNINGSKYTTGTTAGYVNSMSIYVGPTVASSPNNKFELAIYTDSSGSPGSLVAKSTTETLTANGWNTVSINAYLAPSTSYWFFYNTNGLTTSDNDAYYNSGGNGYLKASTFGTWPTTISGGSTSTVTFSIYATFGDPYTRKVTATTTWNFNSARQDSVSSTEYLTNWKSKKGGMIVYGNGGTTTDDLQYRIFDASSSAWLTAATAFDVDTSTTNKALRTVRLYSSKTRDEKIAITRHYNGTAQFIYATVWNGTSWGTPTQLSTWTAATFLDVLNYDGAYLNDGTFMAVYSDNTNIPKYRIWNGTSWGTQGSLTALTASHTPVYIMAANRSGSNEVMVAIFTNGAGTTTAGNTVTEYWNGSAWSATTIHSTASITNTKRFIDFEWSPNSPTTGILAYTDSTTDKNMTIRLCTASGGACTWGTAANAGTAQTNNIGALNIEPRPTANEFQVCNKDAAATPTVVCNKVTFSGTTPTISAPVTIAAATDTGIQRSFDIDWESISGDPMLAVYSDNTAVPKFKKYAAGTSTWDSSATSVTTTGSPGVFKLVRMIPQDTADDIMVLMSDANLDVFSIIWNGSGDAMYTTPAAKAYTGHGTNGSATTDYWFDFAWDRY